jgi:hypothetical protein
MGDCGCGVKVECTEKDCGGCALCNLRLAAGPPRHFGRESQCVLALGVMVVLLTIVKMELPSSMSSCLLSDSRPPVCWNGTTKRWLVQSML